MQRKVRSRRQALDTLARQSERHLRELIEQGFEVVVVKDATAAPRHPELGDGYKAALINFGYIANAVLSTDEVVKAMSKRANRAIFAAHSHRSLGI